MGETKIKDVFTTGMGLVLGLSGWGFVLWFLPSQNDPYEAKFLMLPPVSIAQLRAAPSSYDDKTVHLVVRLMGENRDGYFVVYNDDIEPQCYIGDQGFSAHPEENPKLLIVDLERNSEFGTPTKNKQCDLIHLDLVGNFDSKSNKFHSSYFKWRLEERKDKHQ